MARLAAAGLDANVVSSGEWAAARAAGLPNDRITLEGVGKSDGGPAGGGPRLRRWQPTALGRRRERRGARRVGDAGRPGGAGAPSAPWAGRLPAIEVLLRLNPDVQPETHAGLAVGRGSSKFGMTETELTAAVASLSLDGPVAPRGIHLHVGSQLGAVDAWRDAVRRGLAVLALLRARIAGLRHARRWRRIPRWRPRHGADARPVRRASCPPCSRRSPWTGGPCGWRWSPGGSSSPALGWIVATVLHVRERGGAERVVVVDAGMTELIRPMLYGAEHPVVALTSLGVAVSGHAGQVAAGETPTPVRLDGPICESTDTFGRYDLPPLRRGDLLAIGETGAYAASMASTYNGRPAAPQVLLEEDGALTLGRRRGRTGPAGPLR